MDHVFIHNYYPQNGQGAASHTLVIIHIIYTPGPPGRGRGCIGVDVEEVEEEDPL